MSWTPEDRSLIGLFFHSFAKKDDGNRRVNYQGQIVSFLNDCTYLAQMFSWLDGSPTTLQIFSLEQMVEWAFYEDADDWRRRGDELFQAFRESQFSQRERRGLPVISDEPNMGGDLTSLDPKTEIYFDTGHNVVGITAGNLIGLLHKAMNDESVPVIVGS